MIREINNSSINPLSANPPICFIYLCESVSELQYPVWAVLCKALRGKAVASISLLNLSEPPKATEPSNPSIQDSLNFYLIYIKFFMYI